MTKKFIYLASSVFVLSLAAGFAGAQEVSINFQTQGATIPEGYLPDYGEVFGDRGNGFSYGWDVDSTGAARDRDNASAPDQRYDTVNHLQPNRTDPERTWEIALANGSYNVFIVCGDPSYGDSINTLDVEGMVITDPDGEDNFDEYTVAVIVTDGRLTIKQAPDPRTTYAKLCFVDITLGIPLGAARGPDPANGATDVPRDVTLSWSPGAYAPALNGHRVYLNESFGDVNDGIGGTTVSASSYEPGRLNFETTYYWRVDEVNAPPDSTVYPGEVWSFTTEPVGYPLDGANITATASSAGGADFGPEKTIDGSGLDPNDLHSTDPTDMWLSDNEPSGAWIQYEFDKPYKLHEMWLWNSNQIFEGLFGFGFKDVTIECSTNGVDWTALAGVPEFAKAPGTDGYAHDTTVDFGGAAAKHVKLTATSNWGGVLPQFGLSEVRFFYIPVSAREPSPDAGAVDVNPAVTLSWRAGREAATHDVYLSTDEQAVIDGNVPAVSVTEASYSSDLDLAGTYYWRIDEVNDVETPTAWQGDVWSFSTPDYLVVDDFESYNDIDPPDPESHTIFESWSDGFGIATNGALVGNDFPPYLEQTIVHGGDQSMPLFYSNTGGAVSSETARTFAPGQDWTKHGIETLVLYFQGIPGNTGQLYVKVNGVKVPYPGDAANIARLLWTQWTIDLASLGVNLTSVTSLAIGIDGNGAAGTLYIDDIVLYRLAPPEPAEQIYLETEAAAPLGASWRVYTDPASSGGSHIGSEDGDGDDNDTAPGAAWVATYSFDASGGTYKVLFRGQEQGSDSFWVRITTATAQSHEDPDQPGTGWVRFNELDAPSGWAWDEVHSNDHSNAVVSWTLPAGANTIEIAKREDGVWLDTIVISKID